MHSLLPVGAEAAWIKIGAVLGVIWGATLESVAPLVYWYLAFMAADLLTGIWAACRTGTFSSKRLSFGMAKKGLAFFIITLAHGIDVSFWFVRLDRRKHRESWFRRRTASSPQEAFLDA